MAEKWSSQFFPVLFGGEAGGTEGKRWVETGGSGGGGEKLRWGRGWLRNKPRRKRDCGQRVISGGPWRLAGGQVDGALSPERRLSALASMGNAGERRANALRGELCCRPSSVRGMWLSERVSTIRDESRARSSISPASSKYNSCSHS